MPTRERVASSAQGVIKFPGLWRRSRVVVVARSALSQAHVAAEQANAPNREHDGCYVPSRGCAAGDWRR
jgi:hypothetical protein